MAMAPFTNAPFISLSALHPFLLTSTVYNVRLAHIPYIQLSYPRNRSDISGTTTASTKTFLTALVLNSIIAGVEISTFTLVRRYFRLVYEPRSLSVFESCVCAFVLQCFAYHRIGRGRSHYPLASWDGLFLSLMRIIVRSRISTDWTVTFSSVSSA